MENVFQEVRNENMNVTSKLVDILFRGLDALEAYLKCIMETSDEGDDENDDVISGLQEVLNEGLGKQVEASTQAEESVRSDQGSNRCKYREISLGENEDSLLEKVAEDGKNLFGITVYLAETCILKSARAFLVFKALEGRGELLKSVPTIEEIEDEEFDLDFSWLFVTDLTLEEVRASILNVSEIEDVCIEEYDGYRTIQKNEKPIVSKEVSVDNVKSEKASSSKGADNSSKSNKSATKHTSNAYATLRSRNSGGNLKVTFL